MSNPELILIPADLEVVPFETLLKEVPSAMSFESIVNQEHYPTIRGAIEMDHTGRTKFQADIYGYLQLKCLITGTKLMLPLIHSEGQTVQSFNNSSFMDCMSKQSAIMVINITDNHFAMSSTGQKKLFIEHGRQVSFVPQYMEVALYASLADEAVPLHVLWSGESELPDELFEDRE